MFTWKKFKMWLIFFGSCLLTVGALLFSFTLSALLFGLFFKIALMWF